MATLGSLLVALAFVVPQFWFSRHLDRSLAKRWKRLPIWGYGAHPASRRHALYQWPVLSTALATGFAGLSARNDIEPGVRSAHEMVIASAIAIGLWSLVYPVRIYMIRRWIRTGRPEVRGLTHPSGNCG